MAGFAGKRRKLGTRERSELFTSRRDRKQLFDFVQLDTAVILAALNVAVREGVVLSFSQAQGGYGVTLRVYMDDKADVEFAGSPEELEELLTLFVDGVGGKSEDLIQLTQLAMASRKSTN